MPNANVLVRIGVQSRKRSDELWKMTSIWTEAFELTTTLESYLSATAAVADAAYAYVEAQRALLAENTIHCMVTVENVTHPTPAAGVIPLAKQHRDWTISGDELQSSQLLTDTINSVIADLRQRAKY